jgi:NADH-quinone oxidoreductase subunit N
LGIIFPNKAKIIKFLNLISAFYLLIFFYLTTGEYIYNPESFDKIILNSFHQNYNLYINLFFFISTITVFLFFLSISDIFYLEENMKIEYTLLVFYVYIGALLLITSLDFISIIILLECIAFSSYVLVGFERKNKFSTSAALKYLILAAIPSGFFILGISILYNNYGSFYQDYLEILLVSFDKFNLTSLD